MKDERRTKAQLIEELAKLRQGDLRHLRQSLQTLEERDRLIATFQGMALVAQQTLDPRMMLTELSRLMVEAGLFRSLTAPSSTGTGTASRR